MPVDEKTTLANILGTELLAAARAGYEHFTLNRQNSVLSGCDSGQQIDALPGRELRLEYFLTRADLFTFQTVVPNVK
ncbi:MAG: hypothetical protein MK165_16475 [Pirellulaceae bacterium]|nr:hypothetical protein [Pirellulaceae bacterium]